MFRPQIIGFWPFPLLAKFLDFFFFFFESNHVYNLIITLVRQFASLLQGGMGYILLIILSPNLLMDDVRALPVQWNF